MARRGYQGESPKDRATDLMDKFIERGKRRHKNKPMAEEEEIPIHMRSLKDQIEYYDNIPEKVKFKKQYPDLVSWLKRVEVLSGMYHITFDDMVMPHIKEVRELWNNATTPIAALQLLKKRNIL